MCWFSSPIPGRATPSFFMRHWRVERLTHLLQSAAVRVVTVWLGYRALNQDFEDAGDGDRFTMGVTYLGPELGVTLRL